MAALAFLLECSAIAAFTGAGASLLALSGLLISKPFTQRWVPSRRADFSFFLGTMPAVLSVVVVVAAAAPSILGALGFLEDHCPTHQHHVHLCVIHASALRPLLATVGAFSLAVFLFRAGALTKRIFEMRIRLQALERLGVRQDGRFPVVTVPAGPKLCHAVGVFRRRILISSDLSRAMAEEERAAALAHEEAHLRRHDPAAFVALSVASLFAVPMVAQLFQARFHEATEEACDAEAAYAVGSPRIVAMALVNVAALQHQSATPSAIVPAFGENALERRVCLLLEEGNPQIAPARAMVLVSLTAGLVMGFALLQSQYLHHAVETLLHRFF